MAIIYLNMQHTVRATTRTGYMISCHLIGLRKTKTLLRPKKTKAERNGGDVASKAAPKILMIR